MIEVMRTVNPVDLSYAQALLKDAGIVPYVMDTNISVLEGSIGILPRRLMVVDEDSDAAKAILREAGITPYDGNPF